jgi:predicted  nucleic acid-binding Zn-ribbon protein
MTSVRQLYVLQELDLVLDRLRQQQNTAETELKSEVSVETLETALNGEAERLQEVALQQRDNQLAAEAHRERSQTLETQLYDGSMTNPRDLESLQQEAANVRQQLDQAEAALLELSIQAEETQSKHAELDRELAEMRQVWDSRQGELNQLIKHLSGELGDHETQRSKLTEGVDPASLQRYETLRMSKKGVAVVKVERGLCQGCQMSLPTHLQQQVRNGRQQVHCSSCGRLLFLS